MTSLLLVTPDLDDNSLGRTYVWWLLARHLGWAADVVSFGGEQVWAPLSDSEFSRVCTRLPQKSVAARSRKVAQLARSYDAVVAIKPLPKSLGIALQAGRLQKFALVVDVDDPDLDARLAHPSPIRRLAWRARYPVFWWRVRNFSRLSKSAAIAVSNPTLAKKYGGSEVPHARFDPGHGNPHTSTNPRVAFIGTVRAHKGINVLREAISRLSRHGFSLVVTATPPPDAHPWEDWVGEGSIGDGEALLATSDIVALPSLTGTFAEGQLPAKLIDAMISGRAVVVSNIEPMPWAVAAPELTITPGSVDELTHALAALADPSHRQRVATQLRHRALKEFSVESVAPIASRVVVEAVQKNQSRNEAKRRRHGT